MQSHKQPMILAHLRALLECLHLLFEFVCYCVLFLIVHCRVSVAFFFLGTMCESEPQAAAKFDRLQFLCWPIQVSFHFLLCPPSSRALVTTDKQVALLATFGPLGLLNYVLPFPSYVGIFSGVRRLIFSALELWSVFV